MTGQATPVAYSLTIPENWYLLPEPGEDAPARFREIIEELDVTPDAELGLARSFVHLLELARPLKPGHRRTYGLVAHAAAGIADAIMSFRVTRVTDEAYGEYLVAIESSEQGDSPIQAVTREVAEARLPSGRAIVLNDVLVLDDQVGIVSPAMERAIVAVFLDTAPVLLEVYVATQNLGRFADISEFALEVAGGYLPDDGE